MKYYIISLEQYRHAVGDPNREVVGLTEVTFPNPDGQKRVSLTRDELQRRFERRLGITIANPNGMGLGRSAFYMMLDDIFGEETP